MGILPRFIPYLLHATVNVVVFPAPVFLVASGSQRYVAHQILHKSHPPFAFSLSPFFPLLSLYRIVKFITLSLVREQCDGASPACSTCVAVYRTNCAYDFDGDHRRKGKLKRDNEQLNEQLKEQLKENDSLVAIVATIRSASDAQVGEIVNHIRKHASLADIATSVKSGPLASSSLAQSLEADLTGLVDRFRVSGGGELRCLGYRPSWSDEIRESRSSSGSWTKVTPDIGLISDLLVSHHDPLSKTTSTRPRGKHTNPDDLHSSLCISRGTILAMFCSRNGAFWPT